VAEVEEIVETGSFDARQRPPAGHLRAPHVLNATPEKRIEQRTVRG
jgi:3-oxoacid CoA-transferase subunit A